MIIATIILGILIIGLIVLINYLSRSGDDLGVGIFFGIWLIICIVIETGIIIDITKEPHPKAMDVYQDKTTLRYIIRDGEVIDSVVVFKNSVYGK